jgi:hypothetical protein
MADDIMDLIKYYTVGAPDTILLTSANRLLGRCKPETRKAAIDWIIDNIPCSDGKYPHKLSVTDIKHALEEVGEPASEYIQTVEWTCDLCGIKFQYAQIVTYADKHDKGIFDYCPRCGLQPCDTMQAQDEAKFQNGNERAWYSRRKEEVNRSWKTGSFRGDSMGVSKPGGWIFNKAQDDAFEAGKRRELVETMKRQARDEIARLGLAKAMKEENR